MQVKKQQLKLDMEQQTGSKLGKVYVKVVYCHPAYLTYMQSTSWETLGWKKHKLESRWPGEISITSDLTPENEAEDLYPAIDKLSITMKNEERETTKEEDYLQLNKQKRSL